MTADQVVVVANSIDPIDASKEFTVTVKNLEVPPPSFPWWIVVTGVAGVGAVAIYYVWKKR